MRQTDLTKIENEVLEALKEQFGEKITGHEKYHDQLSIFISGGSIFDIAQFMKDDSHTGFELLSDICGVDWIDCPDMRFELVYNFFSIKKELRVLIKTTIPDGETPTIRSIQPVYTGADWLEREVYDMLGIDFEGHPDLRRIITPEGLEGWPHRKDFPLTYEAPQFSHNKDNPPEIIK
ncbi:MAG: NADH-quinone oxidoreductase subunit C [candidate division Zixibacteria bacterium]|nr:NADH-quinone oxidoreductase subunit C [candidate division Zixibacteria bacterium]